MFAEHAPILLKRGITRGILTLLRERQWMTALGALLGVFILVQLLMLVLVGLEGMQSMLRSRTDLRLEIRAEATDTEVQNFYSAVNTLPFVQDSIYITKEQSYEQTRQNDPELIGFLEEFNIQNPFSDTIGITLTHLDDYDAFKTFVEREEWQHIVNPTFLSEITDQEEQVYALLAVTRAGRSLTIIILAVTAVALVFITTELIRRRAIGRSDEVLVERLVGATPLSIVLPFITEAVLLLAAAILMSSAVLLLLITALPMLIPALQAQGVLSALSAEATPLLRSMLPMMILLELLIAPIIATIGAWIGVHPQVKSPRIAFAL